MPNHPCWIGPHPCDCGEDDINEPCLGCSDCEEQQASRAGLDHQCITCSNACDCGRDWNGCLGCNECDDDFQDALDRLPDDALDDLPF